jgi:glycosyltransferase involved in cell wall biosynthesis
MRILFCNKYNYPFSGTEVYLFELMELLRSQGHETALFSMADPRGESTPYDHHFVPLVDFKGKAGLWQKARQAAHAVYSLDARQRMRAMIEEFCPDVAHVRNIYHHLSPSILWELKAQNVPVVYHLNDFKVLCPSYNLVAQGEACEACADGAFWNVLRRGCYPGSTGARLTLMTEAYLHRGLGTFRKCVDLFLAPSRFVRDKFVEHGWDGNRFEVLPHFQEIGALTDPLPDGPVLYCGRLSAEKGIEDVLRAMSSLPQLKLVIAGDGPQRPVLQELAATLELRNVDFVGQVGGAERDRLIARSRFTVLPSHAYETLGKTILESYALGRAVIATDMGSRRELVRDGETGILYPTGDVKALARAMETLSADPKLATRMGRAGWEFVRQRHKPEEHCDKLIRIYEWLAERARKRMAGLVREIEIRKPFSWPSSISRPSAVEAVGRGGRRLRVAFVGGRGVVSKYSGIETYYEEVGKHLVERGHEVTVYCRSYFTPPIAERHGMKLVRLPTIQSKHLETVIHTLLSTIHAITQGYDIVHYHCLGPALFSFWPRLFGTKTAVTVQGLDWQRKKWGPVASFILRMGERASVRFPDATMVVSQTLQQRYRELHHVETSCVPNGGLLRDRAAPNEISKFGIEPGNYVLFLGRISPEKGCHLLVEAFDQIDTDVRLVMAGASSYCDDYSRELRRHAGDRIRLLDWVSGDTLDELLTNAMLFVLPSDLEGLSLALLDAMGAGLCVLASDVPENREVVEGAGFTFRRGDARDLAKKLRFLIANPTLREAVGRSARMRIQEKYQWPTIAGEIERVYFEMMGWNERGATTKRPSAHVSAVDGARGMERTG